MYTDFYGFDREPFNVTPDSEFLYPSTQHEKALSRLLYGIRSRKGFVQLTGVVGSGKTTLCRKLVAELEGECSTSLILQSRLNPDELLRTIAEDFGLTVSSSSTTKQIIDQLHEFLLTEFQNNRNVCVIIDECQNLSPEALEHLRLLSNLETEKEKLIQIVLVGQLELEELLKGESLLPIRQRIAVKGFLSNLEAGDVQPFVEHRIRRANPDEDIEFEPGFYRRLHELTGGNPRNIVVLCNQVLIAAYEEGSKRIRLQHLNEAARELHADNTDASATQSVETSPSPPGKSPGIQQYLPDRWLGRQTAMVVLTALLTVLAGWALLHPYLPRITGVQIPGVPSGKLPYSGGADDGEVEARSELVPDTLTNFRQGADEITEPETGSTNAQKQISLVDDLPNPLGVEPDPGASPGTINALVMARYLSYRIGKDEGIRLSNRARLGSQLSGPESLEEFVPEMLPGMWVELDGQNQTLKTHGYPAFLGWKNGKSERNVVYFPESNQFWDPLRGMRKMAPETLDRSWTGVARILVRSSFDPSVTHREGEVNYEVIQIQKLLNQAGDYAIPTNGSYGPQTKKALRDFQEKNGLTADGIAGITTNLALLRGANPTFPWSQTELKAFIQAIKQPATS